MNGLTVIYSHYKNSSLAYLSGRVQERVSWLSEGDLELENTVFIRSLQGKKFFNKIYSEAGDVFGGALLVGEGHSDVGVQHDELQLEFARDERLPGLLLEIVGDDVGFVGEVVIDLVFMGLEGVVVLLRGEKFFGQKYEVMENVDDSDVSSQLEGPVGDAHGEVFIGALAITQHSKLRFTS